MLMSQQNQCREVATGDHTGTVPPPTNRSNPEEEKQRWRRPDIWFQIHSIKPVCCWHKDRQIHKANRAEGPAPYSHSYGLPIFGKDDGTHIEEKTVSLTNGVQQTAL